MARQVGAVKFEGKVGGLSFYKLKGGYYVRMPGGLTKEMLRSSPTCKRVEENTREFGGATKIGKVFRDAFGAVLLAVRDGYLKNRLTKVFYAMCKLDEGVRGSRAISISRFGEMLKGLEFNVNVPFASVFTSPVAASFNAERTITRVVVPDLMPKRTIRAPKGATHVRLVLAAGAVSDFVMGENLNGYRPAVDGMNRLKAVGYSDLLPLKSGVVPSFMLEAAFVGVDFFAADVAVVAALGIEFYQRVNGVDCLLEEGKAMVVLGVV